MSQHVEAIIVAGGLGTRLQPLTTRRPKHLLNVGGVPFLEHQVARLAAAGFPKIEIDPDGYGARRKPIPSSPSQS